MVVEEEAESQHPAWPEMRLVWQHEAQGPGQMRRLGQQHLAFLQGLAHQPELVLLQVAQAAMDELGCLGGGGAREIVHFAKPDLERPPRRVAGDARAIDAAADHEQVERAIFLFVHPARYSRLDRISQESQKAAWVFY